MALEGKYKKYARNVLAKIVKNTVHLRPLLQKLNATPHIGRLFAVKAIT
jgi:hypothetical protein